MTSEYFPSFSIKGTTLLLRFRRNCAASDRVTYVTCCARLWALLRSAGAIQRAQTRPARRREDVWCRNEGIEILLLYHRMAFVATFSCRGAVQPLSCVPDSKDFL